MQVAIYEYRNSRKSLDSQVFGYFNSLDEVEKYVSENYEVVLWVVSTNNESYAYFLTSDDRVLSVEPNNE